MKNPQILYFGPPASYSPGSTQEETLADLSSIMKETADLLGTLAVQTKDPAEQKELRYATGACLTIADLSDKQALAHQIGPTLRSLNKP